MKFSVPSWFPTAPWIARAHWLVDSHHAKNLSEARRMLGKPPARAAKGRVTVQEYQSTLEKHGLS